MRKTASYGSWASPITADSLLKASFGVGAPCADGAALYWLESRPHEGGRQVIVQPGPDGSIRELTPPGFNVRSRVHEYGGGAYLVADGVIYFQNFADQFLYRQVEGGAPELLYGVANHRHADFVLDRQRGRLLAVREDHTQGSAQPPASIVSIGLDGSSQVLVQGADFYSNPRLSPDGSQLAWISWNHPNMPWDGTELWVAAVLADGSLGEAQQIAGGPAESVVQPTWSPEGQLHFISDRTGWWNLYQLTEAGAVAPLCPMAAEFAGPQWSFGQQTYAFAGDDQIACAFTSEGIWRLGLLDRQSGHLHQLELPYTEVSGPKVLPGGLAFIGASPTLSAQVAVWSHDGEVTVLRSTGSTEIDRSQLSVPESIAFPTTEGTAYGLFYRPQNPAFEAPEGERPPLIVMSHGGPTGNASSSLSLSIQYWTSRGFAVLDVNYGGSTGFGRPYRDRLKGNWGVVDVDDCVNGARYLAEQGLVDGARMVIRGGSAGGYTTLCALTFHQVFRAGASHFGIGDLSLLAADTHKFESRYLDQLVGPYPAAEAVYRERSPLHHAERIDCPVIFFQGLEDRVVPPNQAESMVEALRQRGVPVSYIAYEGEGHGFRQAANIKRTLEAELAFYGRVLGFTPADAIEPVRIENF